MKRLIFFASVLVGIVFQPIIGTSQSITSYALPDTLASGDTFNYIITANYQSALFSTVYPNEDAFGDAFEFRGVQRFKGSGVQDSIVYRLQFFGVKDTVLAGKIVQFVQNGDTLALETAPIPIYFRSNLEAEDGELKPFKPIFDFARSWWIFILLGLLLAVLVYFAWRHKDRFLHKTPEPLEDTTEPIPPFVSPFFIFDTTLRELKQIDNFIGEEGLMRWHVQLSDAIRTYLESTHNIDALEMTTREINNAMLADKMHPDVTSMTFDILRECDMVKFAKLTVDTHQTLLVFEKAEKLRDLFRFMDEAKLKDLKYQYEMLHGFRQEKSTRKTDSVSGISPESVIDESNKEEI
jgi:hypothetical protein